MRGELPSTRALLSFEAVARLQSLRRAAEELCVSESALSKQLQLLESQLGAALFDRKNRRLSLTAAGARYAERVREILEMLRSATGQVRPQAAADHIRILVPPAFSSFLLPRLPDYAAHHPEAQVSLINYDNMGPPDYAGTGADAAIIIYDGSHDPAQLSVDPLLLNCYSVPVCAPSLLADGRPLDSVEQLAGFTWLYVRGFTGLWDRWLAAVGATGIEPKNIVWFDDAQTAHAAAKSGIGIAISGGGANASHPFLEEGSLVAAHGFHLVWGAPVTYYLCIPRPFLHKPAVAAFRRWLLEAFDCERHGLCVSKVQPA